MSRRACVPKHACARARRKCTTQPTNSASASASSFLLLSFFSVAALNLSPSSRLFLGTRGGGARVSRGRKGRQQLAWLHTSVKRHVKRSRIAKARASAGGAPLFGGFREFPVRLGER